ncbi:hypothetical protein JCM10295v2_007073 [Rhodotorula toruloides]
MEELTEVQYGSVAVPQYLARSYSRSPPPHLGNLNYASHPTELLDALRHHARTIPLSTEKPAHLDTLLSFLQPNSSTSSHPLPARQLAYVEALVALSPQDVDAWEVTAAQGVIWTRDALERLVDILERVAAGTTADSGQAGLDGERGRTTVFGVEVAKWLKGIEEYVARQVEGKTGAKGEGKAVECYSSFEATPRSLHDFRSYHQAAPDFPFSKLDAVDSPRRDVAASTSRRRFRSTTPRRPSLPATAPHRVGRPPSSDPLPVLARITRSWPLAKATNSRRLNPKDPANLLTSSGRRILLFERAEGCMTPPERFVLDESGQRRVKEEDVEVGDGMLGAYGEVEFEADGDAGWRDRAREARKIASQVEGEDADDVPRVLKEPSPAQKPVLHAKGQQEELNGVVDAQHEAGQPNASAKNGSRRTSPSSQYQRLSANSSGARLPPLTPTPPPAQQQQEKKTVRREAPLIKKAQAWSFRPSSDDEEEEEEVDAPSLKDRKGKGKTVRQVSKKHGHEEQDDELDELDSDTEGMGEASCEKQKDDGDESTQAKVDRRKKKVAAAPAKKRPLPTVKKVGTAPRSAPRKAASSSKGTTKTNKTAKKRVARSCTTSEDDDIDQLATDIEGDIRPPPKKRTRSSSVSTGASHRRKNSTSGTSASSASSPKAGKKAVTAKKSTPAPAKPHKPVKEGSMRSARVSSEAPGVKKEEEGSIEAGTIGFAVQRTEGSRCWPVWILRSDEHGIVFCPLPGTRPIADTESVFCANSLQLVSSSPIVPVPDGTPILPGAKAQALRLAQELAANKRELKKWVARVEKVWAEQEVEQESE